MWREYIKEQGILEIAAKMKVTRQTVYNWLNGAYPIPDPVKKKLIKLSGGAFGIMDFYKGK